MKFSGFISYHVADQEAAGLAAFLDTRLETLGFRVWRWGKSQRTGQRTREEIASEISASHFFLPIISKGFRDRPACLEELELALNVYARRRLSHFNAPFIFPLRLAGAQLPQALEGLGLTYSDLPEPTDTLAIDRLIGHIQSPCNYVPALVSRHKYSFNNLPSPFVLDDGGIDALIVLGHSAKASGKPRSDRLMQGIQLAGHILKPAASPQTNRPAEFVPELVSSLERSSLRRYGPEEDVQHMQRPVCFTDEVLIDREKFTELLAKHNLICLGAGDTNGVTKWILDYYAGLLPVQFDYSNSSHVLHFADDDGALRVLRSSDPSSGKLIGYQGGPKPFIALTFMLPNPANHEKVALVIAGLVALGTQAATLAVAQWWSGIKENSNIEGNWLRVVDAYETAPDDYRPGGFRFLL